MEKAYTNLPGLAANATKPVVMSLLLKEQQLNVERMMKVMAVDDKDHAMPLYMEVCLTADIILTLGTMESVTRENTRRDRLD